MAKAKETGIDIKGISANLLKKLAAQLGYSSAANKDQLIKELRKANDYRGRLAGVITDLSPKARKFYEEHANDSRIELNKLRKESKLSDKEFDKVIDELEQAALCAKLRRSSKKTTGAVYEFITNASFMIEPDKDTQLHEVFTVRAFLMDLVRLLQMVRQKAPRVLSDGSAGVRFLSKLESVVLATADMKHEYEDLYLQLLYWISLETGLTYLDGKEMKVSDKADEFFSLASHVRVQELFEAWLRNKGINEYEFSSKVQLKGKPAPGLNDIPDSQRLKTARRMMTESLSLLDEKHKWFSVRDFAAFSRTRTPDMIVKSISEDDALNMNLTYRGIYTGKSSDLHDGIPRASNWHVVEGEFVAKAIWMLAVLGVVHISKDLEWFSLSPEGRYCLGLTDEPQTESEAEECLVVQPNFEIVVYPRKARPETLHILGSFGDLESDQESLVYKMSLNSVYRAAEAGLELDTIFEFLKKNSTTSIPDNVEKTLQEWWDRCNMIFFSETADLIELSEAEPYDRLPDSFKKQAIKSGDFLIFPDKFHHSTSGIEVADYQDRVQCCRIEDDGTIFLNKKKVDVFLLSYFRKFTNEVKETHKEYVRKLDEKAVGATEECTADRILDTLDEVSPDIPASISIKLRALENKLPPAQTFDIVAVCLPEALREDSLDEKLLQSHSLGRIKDYWLLTASDFAKVKKTMKELGLKLESQVISSKKGMSVETKEEKKEEAESSEHKLDEDEKLKVIEKAIKNGLQMQIVYELPDGEQDMLVKPTQVLTSNEEKIVEAVDDTTGMSVMLTAEKITGIKKVARPSGRY